MLPKPKKRLGQNFLLDKNIQRKIAAACDIADFDTVLEIGPGTGALTPLLAQKARKVCAVEIDKALCERLRPELQPHPNVSIVCGDILKTDLKRLFSGQAEKIKVVGNIPYYITTPIIEHLLTYRSMIGSIYLTVQKEFARRMAAGPGSKEYGALSCFVQYYTEPEILFQIKKNSFVPAPKVDSCFLRLAMRQQPAVAVDDEALFFRIIRASFQKRRKQMKNCLKELIPAQMPDTVFAECGLDPAARPEELSLSGFACIANAIVRHTR